jgi:segregation and condensation protein A
LDLLLQLIEHEELDITRLALARVTDQYLHYIHNLDREATNEISAFLVIAARLLQIKSTALLPQTNLKIGFEEDDADDLVSQLIEYRRYKKAAEKLLKHEIDRNRTFLRVSTPYYIEPTLDLSGVTVSDLYEAALGAFSRVNRDGLLTTTLSNIRFRIRNKINNIAKVLQKQKKVGFWALFQDDRTRINVVVTFLALLELIKQHFVEAHQEGLYEEIEIEIADTWDLNEEIELEFGE